MADPIVVTDLRDLDALVAQHVMGWTSDYQGWHWGEVHRQTGTWTFRAFRGWSPTDNANAMMEVVELVTRLCELPDIEIKGRSVGRVDEMWSVAVFDVGSFSAYHQSLPVAVCLAALAAVGVDVRLEQLSGRDPGQPGGTATDD